MSAIGTLGAALAIVGVLVLMGGGNVVLLCIGLSLMVVALVIQGNKEEA